MAKHAKHAMPEPGRSADSAVAESLYDVVIEPDDSSDSSGAWGSHDPVDAHGSTSGDSRNTAGQFTPQAYDAQPLEKPKKGVGRVVIIVAIVVFSLALVALGVLAAYVVTRPVEVEEPTHVEEEVTATLDADLSTKKEEEAYIEAHKGHPKVNPLIAQCSGIDLRSPIDPAYLSGVLFHQASYKYGLVMTTQMPTAKLEEVEKTRQTRINREQYEGDWLDADALHIWRTTDKTDMDTSIDVGAQAGTVVKSPVTGTVVLVKDYKLYGEVPDIEIHIQPDGRPDLDVVLIHTTDPLVKAGDKVEAGVTEISHVRDIAKSLTDVQLSFYTPKEDPGNHTHVQVNNADYPNYRTQKLDGAFTVS